MNAIVIVFIPRDEPRVRAMAERLRARPETRAGELISREQEPPLWTWFVENPRRHAA